MQSMLLPFFVLFPLVNAVTTSANDKRSSVNATVSFHRPSAVVVDADNSQTANVVYGGHNLQTDESEKRSADAVNRKHFKGLAIFSSEPRIWPGAVVPYELVPYLNDTQRGHVRYAINAFQKNTCIKFRKRTERDMYYLLITAIPKKWCYSVIGRDISSHPTNEGKFISDLNMDPDCFNRPAMIHELMHSIGFYHEHQREDRDPLVTAGPPEFPDPARDYANRGMTISRTQAQYMGEYDSDSVMHYPFKNFKPYIRTYFTRSDIDNINTLYKCSMKKNNMRRNAVWTTSTWNPRKVTRFLPATFLEFFVKVAQTALSVNIKTNIPIRKNNMNARNIRGKPAIGKNNAPWTTFRRKSKNAARTTPATRSFNNYRRHFEAKNARRTNAPARIYNNARNTRGRPAVGKNNAPRTSFRRNSKNAARTTPATWSSDNYKRYFEAKSVRRTNAPARMYSKNARNTRGRPAIGTNNAWTNFRRNSRNAALNPLTWNSNNYRRYIERKNARRTNTPATSYSKNARNTRGRPAIGKNYAHWTNFRRSSRNAARTTPATWSSNNYRKYFKAKNVKRTSVPARIYNNARNTRGRPAVGKNNASRTTFRRKSKNAARTTPATRSSNNYRKYFGMKNAKRANAPARIHNKNARNTRGRPAIGTNYAPLTNFERNSKNAEGSPLTWNSNSNNLYRRYFAGSSAVRKNTAPRGNNINIRNTSGETLMRKYNPHTNAKRNPGNAAKRSPVSRSSSSHSRTDFTGNNRRNKTFLKKNFSNFRNTPWRSPLGMNRAAWNVRRSTKDAAIKNFSRWRSGSPNRRFLARNNAIRKKRTSKRYNSRKAESISGRAARTNNIADRRNSTRNAT